MEFQIHQDSALIADKKKSVRDCWSGFCLSPFSKYAIPSFFLAVLLVAGVYLAAEIWLLPQNELEIISTCHLEQSYYVSCVPNGQLDDPEDCINLACCWREDLKLCYHAFPSRYGYKIQGYTDVNKKEGILSSLRETSPFGSPMKMWLKFRIEEIDDRRTCISLITNVTESDKMIGSEKLFKSGTNLFTSRVSSGVNAKMVAYVQEPQFAVTLTREDDSSVILSTGRGALIVTDKYWEWTLHLPSTGSLYGLQHLELNGSRDWIYNSENASDVQPAFLAIDSRGKAASCYLEYDGPLEVQVLNVSKLVILRGISVPQELRLIVTSGINGTEASQQLAARYARSTTLSATALGLHVCPELEERTEDLAKFARRMSDVRAPWDSHCMHRRLGLALQHAANLSQVARVRSLLLQQGRSLSPHLTPMLFHNPGSELQVKLEQETCLLRNGSDVYVGLHENGSVIYPDWRKAKARQLLHASISKYVAELSTDFIVLRDGWPKDDMEDGSLPDLRQFHYLPQAVRQLLSGHTLPWDLEEGKHYATHNAYSRAFADSIAEAKVTAIELAGNRCNSGATDSASWQSLKSLFRAGLTNSMLGQLPPVMYVCAAGERGYRLNDELCLRWYGLAVAWPYVLSLPEKSPGGDKLSRLGAARAAKLLRFRASLASYQRTVLAKYALDGSPVLAATSLLYPEERQPRNTSMSQFLWGVGLLIGIILEPKRSQVWMWIPGKHAWRHLQDGLPEQPTGGDGVSVLASVGQIVTLVRPGHIIPLHDVESEEVAKSTASALASSLTLVANGICDSEERHSCQAKGSVYYEADKMKQGAFLYVQLVNATLVLTNLKAVRLVACPQNSSQNQDEVRDQMHTTGSSHLEALRLLNDDSKFAIGNLCEFNQGDDIWHLHLKD